MISSSLSNLFVSIQTYRMFQVHKDHRINGPDFTPAASRIEYFVAGAGLDFAPA